MVWRDVCLRIRGFVKLHYIENSVCTKDSFVCLPVLVLVVAAGSSRFYESSEVSIGCVPASLFFMLVIDILAFFPCHIQCSYVHFTLRI